VIGAVAAAIAAVLFLPGLARAEKAPRVGIVVSVQVNLKKSECTQLSEDLGRALHEKLVVDVIAGAEATRRLPAEGVSEACVADEACIRDTAQRLSADEILFLAAVRVGNRIQVDSTWVDPANGRNASRPKVVMVKLEEAHERFGDAASLLLPDASVRSIPEAAGNGGGGGDFGPEGASGTVLVRTTPRRMTVPAWILAGTAVAAGGTSFAIWLGLRSDHKRCSEAVNDGDPMTSCPQPVINSIEDKKITADIFAVGAGAALVAGALVYYFSGGDIERVPVTRDQALNFRIDPEGGAFVTFEGRM
jgi:hypothetical protein